MPAGFKAQTEATEELSCLLASKTYSLVREAGTHA
jgi:hypothetical protein